MQELVRVGKICEVIDSRIEIVSDIFQKSNWREKEKKFREKNWELRVMCRGPSGVSKTQTSKTQTSDPKNSDPLGVSKTQTLKIKQI